MSSGFVTEKEIEEKRLKRQEEWEKVRTADQPLEAPEEQYDHRSLYERLEEQRKKKDDEYEEAHKLKNMVRGLDDDEVEFLDTVERVKETVEKRARMEEQKEINEFRNAVATFAERSVEERLKHEISKPAIPKVASNNRSSQMKLLAGAVVRKRPSNEPCPPAKKACTELNGSPVLSEDSPTKVADEESESKNVTSTPSEDVDQDVNGVTSLVKPVAVLPSNLQCIGILPGLGSYPDTSDSDPSSESDCELPQPSRFDLLGRTAQHHKPVKQEPQS